ncbi:MAG: TIGR02300 family protein [Alphaproteobacteria bacterium]|nr:TIGR02300 family protein [Alphaproteobacteria bacterium]
MAKPEWGTKRICPSCGCKFYDMQHMPCVCPKCETKFDPAQALRGSRKAAAAAAAAEKEKAKNAKAKLAAVPIEAEDVVGVVLEGDEVEEEGDEILEDASDLGEDDDDMAEVMEHIDEEGDAEP